MTPAAELWAAVVKHCATGRGYGIMMADDEIRFYKNRLPVAVVRPNASEPTWAAEYPGLIVYDVHPTADEAVRAALRIVAPSTEPNVSC